MPREGAPDFGGVVSRHEAAPEDRVGKLWIVIFAFGAVFMTLVSLIFDPRPGPPRIVYYLLVAGMALACIRGATSRWFATPMVLLERGIFLPAYRPVHWLNLKGRAIAFSDIKRVELDDTGLRSGTHLFETTRGPKRCAKAYFPPPRRFAAELKRAAPDLEVEFVDRRGKKKRASRPLEKRPSTTKPKGG